MHIFMNIPIIILNVFFCLIYCETKHAFYIKTKIYMTGVLGTGFSHLTLKQT